MAPGVARRSGGRTSRATSGKRRHHGRGRRRHRRLLTEHAEIIGWLDILLKGKSEDQAQARTEIAMILEAKGFADDAEEAYWTNVQARSTDRRAYERLIALYQHRQGPSVRVAGRSKLEEVFAGPEPPRVAHPQPATAPVSRPLLRAADASRTRRLVSLARQLTSPTCRGRIPAPGRRAPARSASALLRAALRRPRGAHSAPRRPLAARLPAPFHRSQVSRPSRPWRRLVVMCSGDRGRAGRVRFPGRSDGRRRARLAAESRPVASAVRPRAAADRPPADDDPRLPAGLVRRGGLDLLPDPLRGTEGASRLANARPARCRPAAWTPPPASRAPTIRAPPSPAPTSSRASTWRRTGPAARA